MNLLNNFLFIVFPYVGGIVFILGVTYRFRTAGYQTSSMSSQFLEGEKLFFGITAFHVGLGIIFFGHLTAFLFPRDVLLWNSHPVRLIILEVTAFAFGISIIVGLLALLFRRLSDARIRAVTTRMDLVIEFLLFAQVVLGCWIAIGYRWGSSWFAADLSPYLWSLVKFNPKIEAVIAMPLVIKLHIIGAFLILLLVPFTRLVHFIAIPIKYLWRPYQKVVWNWNRKKVRDPKESWSRKRPKNT